MQNDQNFYKLYGEEIPAKEETEFIGRPRSTRPTKMANQPLPWISNHVQRHIPQEPDKRKDTVPAFGYFDSVESEVSGQFDEHPQDHNHLAAQCKYPKRIKILNMQFVQKN